MIAKVSGSHCKILNTEQLAAGSRGIYPITVQLGEEWQELDGVIAVFSTYGVSIDVNVTGDGAVIRIPHEVLEVDDAPVHLGFDGKLQDGTVVRRTVPVLLGNAAHTLAPSDENEGEATPSLVAQIQAIANALSASVSKSGSVATITITKYNSTTGETDTETATISDGEVGIFDAVYGTTSAAEIEAAYQQGKAIRCNKNAAVLWLVNRVNDHKFYFGGIDGNNRNISAFVEDSGGNTLWGNTAVTLAPIVGPTFTGQPKAPTAAAGTNNTQIATTAFVQNAVSPIKGTFWATYGTTTNAEIEAAYQAGKICLCGYGNIIYELKYSDAATNHSFTATVGNTVYFVRCTSDSWTNGSTALAPVASLPAAATDAPQDLADSAAVGSSAKFAREDHKHKRPSAADIGAYVKPSGGIPKNDLAAAVQASLEKADTALQSAPVTSVNGQTGAVVVKEKFTAEYGVTSVADVLAAIAADKVVIVSDPQEEGGSFGTLMGYDTDTAEATFSIVIGGLLEKIVRVDGDGWHESVVNHPTFDDTYAPFATGTCSGATLTFSDGADSIPLESCSVAIDLEQTGSGDPSENNIRPITLHNAVNIVVSPTSSEDDGMTYEFDLSDNPVCAGTLNPLNGTLEETRICRVIDGTESWTLSTANGYRRFYKSLSALGWPAMDVDQYTKSVSSHFMRKSSSTQTTDTFGAFRISQDGYIVLPDNGSRFASAAELKAWFAEQYANETPVQFAYVPDETETYSVDPQDIFTCLGTNYVWADTGDTALTYRKDPNIALDNAHEIVHVTYGTTTSAEIEALWQAGKTVYCEVTNDIGHLVRVRLTNRVSAVYHSFAAVTGGGKYTYAWCDEDTWNKADGHIRNPSDATPSALGTAFPGISNWWSRADHVHAMPTAANVGAVATSQGVAHAGEFLVVGSDGNVTTVTMTAWQGGSY